jgi:hypothetical protein
MILPLVAVTAAASLLGNETESLGAGADFLAPSRPTADRARNGDVFACDADAVSVLNPGLAAVTSTVSDAEPTDNEESTRATWSICTSTFLVAR